MPFTIAIDGPAASGKGTLSRAIADHYGFEHLDTGLLYRAVGQRVLNGDAAVDAAKTLRSEDLESQGLRAPEVAQAASRIATIPAVRAALVEFQLAFARRDGGAVLDGRDIGTVICPDADVKFFVTASAEIRAERRWRELNTAGHTVTLDTVLSDVKSRDTRDMDRKDAPLKPADDAVILDTTTLSIADALIAAKSVIDLRL